MAEAGDSPAVLPESETGASVTTDPVMPSIELRETPSIVPGFVQLEIFPNPFESVTHLRFSLPQAGNAKLDVYDLQGRRIQQLHNGLLNAGQHQLQWDGRSGNGEKLPDGLYLIRLTVEEKEAVVKKISLQRR